jgi:hypothetical protein
MSMIQNEDFKIIIKFHLIILFYFFKAYIFKGVFKRSVLGWYEFGNGKKCELQHHLYVFIEKSLDLDLQNELSTTHFGPPCCAFTSLYYTCFFF